MPESRFRRFRPSLALPIMLSAVIFGCVPAPQSELADFSAMPAECGGRFAEIEFRVSNPDSWPSDSVQAGEFIDELGRSIRRLSPLEEAACFPLLAELRWMAIGFDALQREAASPDAGESDEAPYNLAIQLRGIVEEKPEFVDSNLTGAIRSLEERLLERADNFENEDIDFRLGLAQQYLAEQFEMDSSMEIGNQMYETLDYLNYYEEIGLVRQREIKIVRENLQNHIAALEAEILNKPRRNYQAWALEQIWAFENAVESLRSDEEFSFFDIPDSWTWNEEEYRKIQTAMIQLLLPIDQTLLDLPVLKHFQAGFDVGWEVLNKQSGRSAQTCVAIASSMTARRSLMMRQGPNVNKIEETDVWRERECGPW